MVCLDGKKEEKKWKFEYTLQPHHHLGYSQDPRGYLLKIEWKETTLVETYSQASMEI